MMNNNEHFLDRSKGALLGLALGDALGTSLEFTQRDSYDPITTITGGGPFNLEPGQWTDDTSLALCLSDSLLSVGGHSAGDQLRQYLLWFTQGKNSSTGSCFDIGNTVRHALIQYMTTGQTDVGRSDPMSAGDGSLMRLSSIVIFFSTIKGHHIDETLSFARESSKTTHAEERVLDACKVFAWLLDTMLTSQIDKHSLLSILKDKFEGLHPDIAAIVAGSFMRKQRDEIRGTGFVVQSLEAALWCFYNSNTFKEGTLLAANLGEDADTTAAIYGQLAGAYYGYDKLPTDWLAILWMKPRLEQAAKDLALFNLQ